MEKDTKFNQSRYITQYQKEHYKQFKANLAPELKQRIDNYCTDIGISKSEFLRRAIDVLENS